MRMRFTKKVTGKLAVLLCLALVLTMFPVSEAKADTGVVAVTEEGGNIRLNAGQATQLTVGTTVTYDGEIYTVSRYTYASNDSTVAAVDESGRLNALRMGSTQVSVAVYTSQRAGSNETDDNSGDDGDNTDNDYNGYGDYNDYNNAGSTYDYDSNYEENSEYLLFTAYYDVSVCPDLSGVTIDKTSQTGCTVSEWSCPTYTFHLKSSEVLTEDWDLVRLSCTSSNSKISVSGELTNNILSITPYATGRTTVTVYINDKQICKLKINTILLQISTNSALLTTKQTKQLSVKGSRNLPIKWSSTNSKVVSVSSKGLIKAKKTGNAIIKAKVGGQLLGCAVSVVTPSKKRAINTGINIARTCTYSLQYRMQSKYYDCSSLVWKAYHKNGANFGNAYYAPVAADICKWCTQKKKLVKGGLSQKNINNMKLNAGDLMFRTGENNGRYRGIYHVEMITGYTCVGFDYRGKPILSLRYAARGDGYADGCGEPVARP